MACAVTRPFEPDCASDLWRMVLGTRSECFFRAVRLAKDSTIFLCTKKQTCLYICYVISQQVESKKQDVDTRAAKKNIFAVGYQRYCTHRKQLIRKIKNRLPDWWPRGRTHDPTADTLFMCIFWCWILLSLHRVDVQQLRVRVSSQMEIHITGMIWISLFFIVSHRVPYHYNNYTLKRK